jgi:hypothetical protein
MWEAFGWWEGLAEGKMLEGLLKGENELLKGGMLRGGLLKGKELLKENC